MTALGRVMAAGALALALTPSPLAAQSSLVLPADAEPQRPREPRPQPPRRPRPPSTPQSPNAPKPFGVRGYGFYGSTMLAAENTFQAVAGTNRRAGGGGGGQVTHIWKGVFADVGASQLKLEGERVFVDERTIFKLGIPLEISMRSVDLAGGWRFRFGRVSPYAGAGVTFLAYEETSRFAQSGEDVAESGKGPVGLAGVDVAVLRFLHVGGEIRYRSVKDLLGEGGVSKEFDERSAGGLAAALRISLVLR